VSSYYKKDLVNTICSQVAFGMVRLEALNIQNLSGVWYPGL